MHVIEFRTKIKNGIIEIPKEHKNKIRETVRVIILSEEITSGEDFIERLLNSPLKLKEFQPLSREEIYNRN